MLEGNQEWHFSTKSPYASLVGEEEGLFPTKIVWNPWVPTKEGFFAWEAIWGNILTINQLKRGGWMMPKDATCVNGRRIN